MIARICPMDSAYGCSTGDRSSLSHATIASSAASPSGRSATRRCALAVTTSSRQEDDVDLGREVVEERAGGHVPFLGDLRERRVLVALSPSRETARRTRIAVAEKSGCRDRAFL